MLRVLLVEDDDRSIELTRDRLSPYAEFVVAKDRDTALALLNSNIDLDLIICDLRIPASEGSLDVDVAHGLKVHESARLLCPGTPAVFLSGHLTLENVQEALSRGEVQDLFGTRSPVPLVQMFQKVEEGRLLEHVRSMHDEIAALDAIAIDGTASPDLLDDDKRVLRILARRLDATSVRADRLGGLSGATVVRAQLGSPLGQPVGLVVAKLGPIEVVADEIARYRRWVTPLIPPGAHAPEVAHISHGAGRRAGAVYRLADGWTRDLFGVLVEEPHVAGVVVERLRQSLAPWDQVEERADVVIGDLRRERVRDEQLAPYVPALEEIMWQEVEAIELPMRMTVQHCDLHGLNVLISEAAVPLVIDYGTVSPGPACLDPITLELSSHLHDENPGLGWPTADDAESWFDLERYLRDCPIHDFVQACRQWADAVTDSSEEVAAVVYAHAVRQLKYPDTDKDLCIAIAGAAAGRLLG